MTTLFLICCGLIVAVIVVGVALVFADIWYSEQEDGWDNE